MLELPQEHHHELTAAVDALTMQLIARVPLYRDATGTVLVPLHRLLDTAELDPLLEATALTLLHPQTYTLAPRATVLMVPLGEAFAILPFSRHFPDALAHVLQIVAMQTAAEMRPASSPSAPVRARRPHPKRVPARARGVRPRAGRAPQDTPHH